VAVSARSLALKALVALERGRSERLRSELEGRGVEGRELAFAYELSHGVIRRERLLDHVLLGFALRGLPKDPQQRVALRLGAYQLLFVTGMKAHAAVHETVSLIVRNNRGFANAILRRIANSVHECDPESALDELREVALPGGRKVALAKRLPRDEVRRLAIVHSLPDWLAQRFFEQHGIEGLRAIASAASETPGIYLRTGRTSDREQLREALALADVEVADSDHERLLRWTGGSSPFATEPFVSGQFVVQDPTAMRAAQAVPCKPGDTVVDLCAAPGTKTTWLAESVQPDGRVFAFDIDEQRLERIAENAQRLKLTDIIHLVPKVTDLPVADCVLADVPCSNSGVLGRRVEARRRLDAETFAELPKLQAELLEQAIRLTRPGGYTVYSTCSIDLEENQEVVNKVVAAHPGLEIKATELTLPAAGKHDGGFFAVLQRSL
jgi:16S rRNA (cytosine967-C5)-methyltransferase